MRKDMDEWENDHTLIRPVKLPRVRGLHIKRVEVLLFRAVRASGKVGHDANATLYYSAHCLLLPCRHEAGAGRTERHDRLRLEQTHTW